MNDDRRHPFYKRDHDFKYIYCFGIGVMSMGHMKSITETQDYFYDFLDRIDLPMEDRHEIFYNLNNHFEQWIDKVFENIRSKEDQYCFIMDLYCVYRLTSWAKEYCNQILENFLQVFQFSKAEKEFFQEFYMAMLKNDNTIAVGACKKFAAKGYNIRYEILTWAFRDFYMEDNYGSIVVKAGETVTMDKPTIVRGNIYVEQGGSLLVYGAKLTVDGNIKVVGGRIQIEDSDIEILDCQSEYWMELSNVAVVTIVDTVIKGCGECGIIRQDAGRLFMEDSEISNIGDGKGVCFSGRSVHISHCEFEGAYDSLVYIEGSVEAKITYSRFKNAKADYGGGIYSDSLRDVIVENCDFENCQARYLGGGVYFKAQRLGQVLEGCTDYKCKPEDSVYFNLL